MPGLALPQLPCAAADLLDTIRRKRPGQVAQSRRAAAGSGSSASTSTRPPLFRRRPSSSADRSETAATERPRPGRGRQRGRDRKFFQYSAQDVGLASSWAAARGPGPSHGCEAARAGGPAGETGGSLGRAGTRRAKNVSSPVRVVPRLDRTSSHRAPPGPDNRLP